MPYWHMEQFVAAAQWNILYIEAYKVVSLQICI